MRHSNPEQPEAEAPGSKSKLGWRPNLRQAVRLSQSGWVRSCRFQLSLSAPPACCCSFLSELGNEQIAYGVPYCNSAKLNAAHAPVCGDRKPSAGHPPVFLPDAGAREHKVASGSVATPRARELLSA